MPARPYERTIPQDVVDRIVADCHSLAEIAARINLHPAEAEKALAEAYLHGPGGQLTPDEMLKLADVAAGRPWEQWPDDAEAPPTPSTAT